ncbi:MAG: efflux RND transporter permease subunit, partial [Flavobacteriales bacterium]
YKGTEYLIHNLYQSLSLAILIISILMAFMFKSWRMVLVSLLPNLLPLLVTAGIMGFFGIVIKPSTVLVFSIAFGISIDDTIHFLAKYRQELGTKRWNLKSAIIAAVRETGVSMIYTSIVLFFGFSIFMASSFGGTVALGMLVSIALLIAMLANLILLPTLLMSLDSVMSKRILKEPYFETWDEEEDIDFNKLKIRKKE